MAVSETDVRHVAELARLGLPAERVPVIVGELNRILEHMDVLQKVDVARTHEVVGIGDDGMPLRTDGGQPYPLARDLSSFAPATRHGFLLVPRLATHAEPDSVADDAGENVISEELLEEEEQP